MGSAVHGLLVSNSFYFISKNLNLNNLQEIDFVNAARYGPDSVPLLCSEQHLSPYL